MLVPLREQLKDKTFRKWMVKVPTIRVVGNQQPWKVVVQRELEGGWGQKRFWTYPVAYDWVREHLKDFYDLTLHCQRQTFQPPVVVGSNGKLRYRLPDLPSDDPHYWCPYCRRMSEFKTFARHHNLPGIRLYDDPRCVICGIRKKAIRRYGR